MSEPFGSPEGELKGESNGWKLKWFRPFDSVASLPRSGHSPCQGLAMSEPFGSPEGELKGESNGGGGSRTRVRRHVPAELYMLVRF